MNTLELEFKSKSHESDEFYDRYAYLRSSEIYSKWVESNVNCLTERFIDHAGKLYNFIPDIDRNKITFKDESALVFFLLSVPRKIDNYVK